ncbi:MAG: hypothetical protein ACP5LS_06180 [Thermoprotei archaeon]
MNEATRLWVFAAIFSIASYAVSAGLSLGTAAYAASIFLDPLVNLTLPLLILSVGFQAINKRGGALAIGIITAALFALSFMFFLTITELIAGALTEVSAYFVGYRGLKASTINTAVFGLSEGALSVEIGALFLHYAVPALPLVAFAVAFAALGAFIGYLGESITSYLVRSGIMK